MKRMLLGLAVAAAALATGCSAGGPPAAVTPETRWDFGDVPMVVDMNDVEKHEFVIKNEGQGDLKLEDVQVKLLQGC
jgi:hypothetical protein